MHVVGGGLAGCAAALTACRAGAEVRLYERSALPRHKVCGEFLSPGILPQLEQLGLLESFLAAEPARIHRMVLNYGRVEKTAKLPDTAYGLSRFVLDKLLYDAAVSAGAQAAGASAPPGVAPVVLATGRRAVAPRGKRLFGFKSHYRGPVGDAVELYFFRGGYVGVSPVESGLTNICGLASEDILRNWNFRFDDLVASVPTLNRRISPLTREMGWLSTGPLVFRTESRKNPVEGLYPAGDALAFIDPFTGSGMLIAVTTGSMAGSAAAQNLPVRDYLQKCAGLLNRPFEFSSIFRRVLTAGVPSLLARLTPGVLLYRLTRPRLS
ncbi:MAG: FAD-dependent oxidoreductase [Bryobacterales bacterium]|nr:FAD-dependent oxidoreductase [Bryobacterales bacterium]